MAAGRAAKAAGEQLIASSAMEKCCTSCGWEGCPCWHLWDAPCVPAELGRGDLSKESSWLSLFCSPVDCGSARASTGFFWFPSKSGWAQNKGSHLGNRSCSVCGGCHPSQPTAGERAKPGRARCETRSASLAGRACRDRGAQAEPHPPHLCPPLLVLIPLGISESGCWTPFFTDLWEGSQEQLEHGRSPGALPSCCLCSKNSLLLAPKSLCVSCEQLHGSFTRDLGLLHTLCPVRNPAPGQAQGSGGLFRTEVQVLCKLSPADC